VPVSGKHLRVLQRLDKSERHAGGGANLCPQPGIFNPLRALKAGAYESMSTTCAIKRPVVAAVSVASQDAVSCQVKIAVDSIANGIRT
jgi:hypothetical protein